MTGTHTEAASIRRLRLEDATEAAAVIQAAFRDQAVATEPPSGALRESAETVAQAIASGGGAGSFAGSALVAVVLWAEQDGGLYCGRLAVIAAWRRRGLARRLLEEAEREARARGLPCLRLGTRLVLADNRRLFAACGFREGAVSAHAGFAQPTSVTMEKAVS